MSQIKLTKIITGERHENVLSCSFFRMNNPYKDFSKYERGFKLMISSASPLLKDFEIRIYVDENVMDFVVNAVTGYPNVSVILYDCPLFKEGKYHIGTFGTMVRFLPLFEKGNKIVWISDIDLERKFFEINPINYMKKMDINFYIMTFVGYGYNRFPSKYSIIAHRFIVRNYTFPKILLTNFIKKLSEGKYSDVIENLNKTNNKEYSPIPYGLDEYFLNTIIYERINNSGLKIMVNIDYSLDRYIKHIATEKDKKFITNYYYEPTMEKFKIMKELHRKYIPKLNTKYYFKESVIQLMDKLPGPTFSKDYILNSSEL